MFSKKQSYFLTIAILFIGLVAFTICQAHPAIGDEHDPTGRAEESCQIIALSSTIIAKPIMAGLDGKSDHTDQLLRAFSALDFEWAFSNHRSGKVVSLLLPDRTQKLYQFICTYRL